jgi:hypothetical protein
MKGVDVYIHISLTSALAGGQWSASRPGRFTPGERGPSTHWIGGWVDSRAGLETNVMSWLNVSNRQGTVHMFTIKFRNSRYYSITTKAIYRGQTGLLRDNFCFMMCKFQLVWSMHMTITIVLVKLVISSCRWFQNGTKSSNNFV